MNKIVALLVAFSCFFILENAQAQNPVTASVKAIVVNDSTYTLKASLQIQSDWHVYAANPDGLEAPSFKAGLETVSFLGMPTYSIKASKQADVLFKQANVFNKAVDIEQVMVIKGFQPDSLQTTILVNTAKADQFLALEIPVTVALANGKKAVGFQILLPAAATKVTTDACGGDTHDTKKSSGWSVFLLGLLGGLIALITPCVFPMIPVTVSFFTKRSKTRKQGIQNGLLYGSLFPFLDFLKSRYQVVSPIRLTLKVG